MSVTEARRRHEPCNRNKGGWLTQVAIQMLVLQGKTSDTAPVLNQQTRYLTALSGRRGKIQASDFGPVKPTSHVDRERTRYDAAQNCAVQQLQRTLDQTFLRNMNPFEIIHTDGTDTYFLPPIRSRTEIKGVSTREFFVRYFKKYTFTRTRASKSLSGKKIETSFSHNVCTIKNILRIAEFWLNKSN